MWAGMKIVNKVSGFKWDEKRPWSIDGALAEKARWWEEEVRKAREEEERRKMRRRWDDEDENADIMSESASEDTCRDEGIGSIGVSGCGV